MHDEALVDAVDDAAAVCVTRADCDAENDRDGVSEGSGDGLTSGESDACGDADAQRDTDGLLDAVLLDDVEWDADAGGDALGDDDSDVLDEAEAVEEGGGEFVREGVCEGRGDGLADVDSVGEDVSDGDDVTLSDAGAEGEPGGDSEAAGEPVPPPADAVGCELGDGGADGDDAMLGGGGTVESADEVAEARLLVVDSAVATALRLTDTDPLSEVVAAVLGDSSGDLLWDEDGCGELERAGELVTVSETVCGDVGDASIEGVAAALGGGGAVVSADGVVEAWPLEEAVNVTPLALTGAETLCRGEADTSVDCDAH